MSNWRRRAEQSSTNLPMAFTSTTVTGFSNGSSPYCTFTLFWMRIPICWMRFCKSFLILNASASFIVVSFLYGKSTQNCVLQNTFFFSPQCNKIHFFIHSIMNALLRKHKKMYFCTRIGGNLTTEKSGKQLLWRTRSYKQHWKNGRVFNLCRRLTGTD